MRLQVFLSDYTGIEARLSPFDPGTFDCSGVPGFCNPALRSLQLAFSRTTSVGLLCSRIPRNTGCRNRSSRVHSVYLTWQTIAGLTQRQRFISAAVNPWSHRLRPGAGKEKAGC